MNLNRLVAGYVGLAVAMTILFVLLLHALLGVSPVHSNMGFSLALLVGLLLMATRTGLVKHPGMIRGQFTSTERLLLIVGFGIFIPLIIALVLLIP